MSSHKERFVVPLESAEVMMVCREAVASANLRVMEAGNTFLSCKEVSSQSTSFTWPAEITIELQASEKGTIVLMNGSIFGFGPIQSGHLQGQMGNLRNRIEIGLRKVIDSKKQTQLDQQQETPIVTALERLAKLHKDGVLTDEEFQKAKKYLLDS